MLHGRILLVDDDAASRDALAEVLGRRGLEITLAADGAAALQMIAADTPDVVLLDIDMPVLDGYRTLQRIRERYPASVLPVVMLTGLYERQHLLRALEAGANDYITKPYDVQVVTARLQTQLSLNEAYQRIWKLEQGLERRSAALERTNERLAAVNRDLARINDQMSVDLTSAAEVQRALLPTAAPLAPGLHFGWALSPCATLAGDSLNVSMLDDDHVALHLLDVSGHGVRAALWSVTISQMLMPRGEQPSLVRQMGPDGRTLRPTPPAVVVRQLNAQFQFDVQSCQFFTLIYGILDTRNYLLRYVVAGHPGPLYLPRGRAPQDLTGPSMAVGLTPDAEFIEQELQLDPGDRLVLYSDGVTEARQGSREVFGTCRLRETFQRCREEPLAQSVAQALRVVQGFAGGKPEDDVSLLAIEVDAQAPRAARVPRARVEQRSGAIRYAVR